MTIKPGGTMRMDFLSWDITIFHLLILAATGIPENTPSVSAKVNADAGFSVRFTDVSALKVTVPPVHLISPAQSGNTTKESAVMKMSALSLL